MTYSWPDLKSRDASPNNVGLICWTRMQAEAGQQLQQIIRRKELERRSGNGLFFWGVGNAPAAAMQSLARAHVPVPVIFSVMKSKPKREDAEAKEVFAWLGYLNAFGIEQPVPSHAIVLSRARTPKGVKKSHYALICKSEAALELDDGEAFNLAHYRNAGGREAPVGASQVTALLKRAPSQSEIRAASYRVAMRAKLTDGYWVKLTRPVLLPKALAEEIARMGDGDLREWIDLAGRLRHLDQSANVNPQLLL